MIWNCTKPVSTGNKMWPQYVAVLILLLSGFSGGMHIGWPSPSLPKLLSDDFPLNITSEEAASITGVISIGDIIGILVSSVLINLIGRKFTLLLTPPLYVVSELFIRFSSVSIGLLYTGRVIAGVAVGISSIIAPVYICEISEPRIRGVLGSLYMMFWNGGTSLINMVGSFYSIETTSLIMLPFAVLLLLFVFVPETPYYLVMKKKNDQARNSLKKLRWNEDVDKELSVLITDVERQMSEKGRLQDLFLVKSNRIATIIMSILHIMNIFAGVYVLTMYAQIFFADTTDIISAELASVLMQILKLIFMLVATSLIDVVGKRFLLLVSTAGCFATLTFLSICFFLKDYSSVEVNNWMPLLGMAFLSISYAFGWGSVLYCMTGELFSASIKSLAICFVTIISSLSVFASIKLYQVLSDHYSTGVPLLIFGLSQLFAFGFCWWYVPETKGKSLEEIQQGFKRK